MTAADVFVSVVAPLHDDADIVEAFVAEVVGVLRAHYVNHELVLVDDGSADGTRDRVLALLRQFSCVRYLRLTRSFGLEAAIAAGLDTSIGDYAVVILPDCDPPSVLPEMVARSRQTGRTVFGVAARRHGEPAWGRPSSHLFWGAGRRFLGLQVPDDATYFQCLPRSAVNAVARMKDRYRSLRLLAAMVGDGVETLPYGAIRRRAQPRRRGFLASMDLAVGITVSQTTRPLRIMAGLGVLGSALNFFYAAYVVAVYLFKGHVAEGWTTTSLQLSGMFFLLFLIAAVLAEYLGRVLEEARDRPLYHVLEERNSNVMVPSAERRNVVRESA